MAQKDKVKELVGRGLGSYHTKALQQMDRIEKKNKEQNHKINILTNELDNDYLTKTEEGSVISLEHSKEGMVYLDGLQGNTMVNYCTDGSKELTLNGDIDIEGTNIVLTEGVDNGLVDVMCEGNTLVNMFSGKISDLYGGSYRKEEDGYITLVKKTYGDCIHLKTDMYKPSTTYTLIVDVKENTLSSVANLITDSRTYVKSTQGAIGVGQTGIFKIKFTTIDDFSTTTNNLRWGFYLSYAQLDETTRGDITLKFILLEGDWINKEIPQYFEGMKSVGECEDNKIEILSRNDNLFILTQHIPNGWSNGHMIVSENYRTYWIECKPNTKYFIESDKSGNRFGVCCGEVIKFGGVQFPITKGGVFGSNDDTNNVVSTIFTTDNTAKYLFVYTTNNGVFPTPKIMISESSSEKTYIEPRLNKKEISLNEPLRGIGDNKDKFIKQGGKWYIERRNGKFVVDGSDVAYTSTDNYPSDNAHCILTSKFNNLKLGVPILCDKVSTYNTSIWMSTDIGDKCGVSTVSASWGFAVRLTNNLTNVNKTDDEETVKSKFRTYLQSNPITIIYQLETPVYEEITDPTLTTYLDKTHISNNSTIPCNMKIQNSGYNAIIKPSTLYTVALDTNKNGTIGINLGGTKTTTTNNVATITTPAILTDDSLRLYGKGIKGSKVRLLEGDKTNWIPSHFEGMKSSFEDKLQEDGTYKMEILSNNKNLFNENILEKVNSNYYEIINKDNRRCLKIERPSLMYRTRILNQLKKNTSYKISFDMLYDRIKGDGLAQGGSIHIVYTDGTSNSCYASTSYNEWLNASIITPSNKTIRYIQFSYGTNTPTYIDLDTFIIQENNNLVDYVYHKSNSIQLQLNEPLRAVGDVKDRFVLKDGKLMIERNCGEIVLNGSEGDKAVVANGSWLKSSIEGMASVFVLYNTPKKIGYNTSICERFTNTYNANPFTSGKIKSFTYTDHPTLNTMYFNYGDNPNVTTKEWFEWLSQNPTTVVYQLAEPTYEEVPFELQRLILECYEDGTLFFDTNIPPTVTTTYSGETPIVKSVRLNKTEVLKNTDDINDNIVPYLMDMDYRVVCLQLEGGIENISMARLFGGTYEMLQRDIQSKRYSVDEYRHRLDIYLSANKITEDEYEKLGGMLYE